MADISKIKALDGVTYNIKDAAAARTSHSHGNITSDGLISSDTTAASGDKLVLTDSSASHKVIRSGIALGTATNTWLNNSGGWSTPTASQVGAAASSHAHGNITSGGDITATAPTIASGDQLIINDHSASKVTNGPTFDGSTVTTALTPKGTWEHFDNSVWYGTCSTAADTAAKVVTCSGFTLTDGAVVLVRFENTNTAAAANLTLNVNSTGAKAIKIFQNAAPINSVYNGVIYAGAVVLCYYYHVGTTEYWVLNTNTNSYVAYSNTTTDSWRSLLQSTNTISTANSAVSTTTGAVYASQGIAVQPSTATMRASVYNVADKVKLQYNSTTNALDFVFI